MLTYKRILNADTTFQVLMDRPYTVSDLMDSIGRERDNEFGTVFINGDSTLHAFHYSIWEDTYLIGVSNQSVNVYDEYKNVNVSQVNAVICHDSPKHMDYAFKVHLPMK